MSLPVIEAIALGVTALSFLIWIYLILFHGQFWRANQRLSLSFPEPEAWPSITAVIPARNEEAYIGRAVSSLLSQDYPGQLNLVVIDDNSEDETAVVARQAAQEASAAKRLKVLTNAPLPESWAGKMWAVNTGVSAVPDTVDYLLLTDADIEHGPGTVKHLALKAETEKLDLVSLMVKLHCQGFWERLLIPAFVFFFQKLYPFSRVNDAGNPTAGAAGGCMLVRHRAFKDAGSITAIRDRLIDDCALAERIKAKGPIWLGLAEKSRSLRPYDGLAGIWSMVARTAYTQLRYNPWLLAGACLGMLIIYLVPPIALIGGFAMGSVPSVIALTLLGGLSFGLMLLAYFPTYRLYGRSGLAFFMLPLAGFLYTAMTVSSALRHARGAGGGWKGRTYPGAK